MPRRGVGLRRLVFKAMGPRRSRSEPVIVHLRLIPYTPIPYTLISLIPPFPLPPPRNLFSIPQYPIC